MERSEVVKRLDDLFNHMRSIRVRLDEVDEVLHGFHNEVFWRLRIHSSAKIIADAVSILSAQLQLPPLERNWNEVARARDILEGI
jgi:hypothetical protein